MGRRDGLVEGMGRRGKLLDIIVVSEAIDMICCGAGPQTLLVP